MVDHFTKGKLDCIEAATADKALTHMAVRLLTRIGLKYLNRGLGYAYPSIRLLAADLGVTDRSVQRAIALLVKHGYLVVSHGGGRHHANHFQVPPAFDQSKRCWIRRKRVTPKNPIGDSGVPGTPTPTTPYALCRPKGLEAITRHLGALGADELDQLRHLLRIGLHWDVEVTDGSGATRPSV